jgi:hypothetical protein
MMDELNPVVSPRYGCQSSATSSLRISVDPAFFEARTSTAIRLSGGIRSILLEGEIKIDLVIVVNKNSRRLGNDDPTYWLAQERAVSADNTVTNSLE